MIVAWEARFLDVCAPIWGWERMLFLDGGGEIREGLVGVMSGTPKLLGSRRVRKILLGSRRGPCACDEIRGLLEMFHGIIAMSMLMREETE
jgi:hypothetical protein